MKLLIKHVRTVGEGTGWQQQYLVDQGIIQNRTMLKESLTDRLYCGVNVPNLVPDTSD